MPLQKTHHWSRFSLTALNLSLNITETFFPSNCFDVDPFAEEVRW